MATREKVAAVAIDDPQIAENAAHEPIVAAARAPRMPEKSALAAANSSEDICARDADCGAGRACDDARDASLRPGEELR